MCRMCEEKPQLNNLAESSFSELPAGITMKGWKEVPKQTGIKGRKQLQDFYERYGMNVIRFDTEYRLLQKDRKTRPYLHVLIADFYATEFIMALLGTPQVDLPLKVIFDLFGGDNTSAYEDIIQHATIPESSELGADLIRTLAWMRQVEIVEMLDEPMQNYFALVMGGELRWHPFISEKFYKGDSDMLRDAAWISWLPWVKRQPPSVYQFIEQCFHDFYDAEPYGGAGWANAAAVLRQRLAHEFSPDPFANAKLWLDRAFSCEHNNGCLMDKLYDVDMVYSVLEAHHESDLVMLADYASPLVKMLVDKMEQSRLARA